MLLRNLFLKTLRDLRGQVLGWGIGLGLLAAMMAALWPSFRDQTAAIVDMLENYPPALTAFFGDITHMAEWSGWLQVEFFSWVPPILAIFAVSAGTNLVAGEEERGTLDLLLSQPIRRWRVVVAKAGALALAALLICALTAVLLAVSAALAGETQDLGRLALATLDIAPVTVASGTLALALSVLVRSRRLATSLAIVVAIGSWFVDSLGKVVDVLEPYRFLALFHYYNGGALEPDAVYWRNIAVLLGLSALFVAAAVAAFQRRDLAV